MAQATGPENNGPKRTLPGLPALESVLSEQYARVDLATGQYALRTGEKVGCRPGWYKVVVFAFAAGFYGPNLYLENLIGKYMFGWTFFWVIQTGIIAAIKQYTSNATSQTLWADASSVPKIWAFS